MPGAGLLSIAMRKAILVILTSAAALSVACAGIESAANRNPDATQNQSGAGGAKTVLAPPDLPRVVKKEGWLIPGLEGSRVHDDRVLS